MRSMLMTNPGLAAARLGQDPFEMTTQAAGAVFPFVMQQGLRDLRGVVVGMNVLAGGAFVFDPFRAYANGLVTNPNMAIFGSPGQGKSALVKTLLSRMDALSGASRFVAIIDPKGEYIDLAGWLGYQVLSLRPNGGVRLNPLGGDATIEEGATDRRSKLVGALAGQVLDRPLSGLRNRPSGRRSRSSEHMTVRPSAIWWSCSASPPPSCSPQLRSTARIGRGRPTRFAAPCRGWSTGRCAACSTATTA
jgi:hypothetical protein